MDRRSFNLMALASLFFPHLGKKQEVRMIQHSQGCRCLNCLAKGLTLDPPPYDGKEYVPEAILVPADDLHPMNKMKVAAEQFGPWKSDWLPIATGDSAEMAADFREAKVILPEDPENEIWGEVLVREVKFPKTFDSEPQKYIQVVFETENTRRKDDNNA